MCHFLKQKCRICRVNSDGFICNATSVTRFTIVYKMNFKESHQMLYICMFNSLVAVGCSGCVLRIAAHF